MTDLRSQLQGTLGSAYSLERELGGGGMSRVFLAEETSLGRKVVVKVLPPELSAGVNVDRFKREIQVAARLQHAHIVPVLTAGEMAGIPYYTMPFVEGESLRARIARTGALPVTEAIGLLRDVAKALAYAHERGLVHRDIKPDNVMLSGGSAMVVDFGIAKAISVSRTDAPGGTLTQVGTSIGTPAYMAPEQAAGDPATDFRADLYSFGCMAYEALAGRPPFVESTPQRLLAAQMAQTPASVHAHRPDTPDALATLVARCLEKDPAERPQSAAEIVRTLDTVTSGGGHDAMPAILLGGPGMLKKALGIYAAAFVAVAIVAQAAVTAVGLPQWVFPGSLIVMGLGLPVILFTGYVHRTTRRLIQMTPQLTPGGTPSLPQGTMQTFAMKASPHMSWRRTALGGAWAVGAFILLVGGYMLLRALGIGPAGSLLAAGRFDASEPVLVTDFRVANADSSLGRVLSDAAKTQLAQSSMISLLAPEGVADALRRMTRPVTSTLDLPLARELAVRNGIKAIVDGEITGLGAGGYIVSMKLVTADSARELASFRETASDAAGLIDAVDQLSRRLRGRMGESLKRVNAAPPLARVTTGSLDALRKFTEGNREADIFNRNAQAITLLSEAVAIDPNFAEAWRKLGIVQSNAARPRPQIDSALRRAYELRDRVPEPQRSMIVAAYYRNGPGRDRGKGAEAYEAMLRMGDSIAANNLALIYVNRRQFAKAESLYRARMRRDPGNLRQLYTNLAVALIRQGKFASLDSIEATAVRQFSDLGTVFARGAIETLYQVGDTGTFRRSIDSVYTRGDSASRVWARSRVRDQALRDGRLSRWQALEREARPAQPTPRQRLNWAMTVAEVWALTTWKNEGAFVARRLDEALAQFRGPLTPDDYLNAARAYARASRPDKARQMLARFRAEIRDTAVVRDYQDNISLRMGDILVAEGKGLEAVEHYRAGDRLPDGPAGVCGVCLSANLARAFDQAEMVDSAMVHYRYYLDTYDAEKYLTDMQVRAQFSKRLGELYEQKGDRENAARRYLDFVNLWRNADPDLQPQVAEVRRRLGRIANVERD